jgi:hypothetical protein
MRWDGVKKSKNGSWPQFTPKQLLICSPMVLGYALDKKLWARIPVDSVKELTAGPDEKAFDNLILSDDSERDNTKFLIKSLVQQHMRRRDGVFGLTDFIEGKGMGLVILLHGECR